MQSKIIQYIYKRNQLLLEWNDNKPYDKLHIHIPIHIKIHEHNINLIDIKSKNMYGKDVSIYYNYNFDLSYYFVHPCLNAPKIKVDYQTDNKELKTILKCLFEDDNFINNYSPAMTPCSIVIYIVSLINSIEEKIAKRSRLFTNFLKNQEPKNEINTHITNIPDDIFDIICDKFGN
jgi:hypothetical protein